MVIMNILFFLRNTREKQAANYKYTMIYFHILILYQNNNGGGRRDLTPILTNILRFVQLKNVNYA